jgi:hypothetical protein
MWWTERRIEIVAVILISVAAVFTSWCAYQSARWSNLQSASYARANASRVESLRQSNLANRQVTIDINLFTAYATAVSSQNHALSDFISQRFPGRLKVAMRSWLSTKPLQNKNAPSSPFVMRQYHLAAQDDADRLERQAGQLFEQGYAANTTADRYVLMTVLFAGVSFLAGVGSKFDVRRIALTALAVSAIVCVSALVVLFDTPTR